MYKARPNFLHSMFLLSVINHHAHKCPSTGRTGKETFPVAERATLEVVNVLLGRAYNTRTARAALFCGPATWCHLLLIPPLPGRPLSLLSTHTTRKPLLAAPPGRLAASLPEDRVCGVFTPSGNIHPSNGRRFSLWALQRETHNQTDHTAASSANLNCGDFAAMATICFLSLSQQLTCLTAVLQFLMSWFKQELFNLPYNITIVLKLQRLSIL